MRLRKLRKGHFAGTADKEKQNTESFSTKTAILITAPRCCRPPSPAASAAGFWRQAQPVHPVDTWHLLPPPPQSSAAPAHSPLWWTPGHSSRATAGCPWSWCHHSPAWKGPSCSSGGGAAILSRFLRSSGRNKRRTRRAPLCLQPPPARTGWKGSSGIQRSGNRQ